MPNTPKLTVKQERDARRAEKVAALKKRQQAEKLKQRVGLAGIITAGVAIIALVIGFVITGGSSGGNSADPTPAADPDSIQIANLIDFGTLAGIHVGPDRVDYQARYNMNPPAGGDHFGAWLNCGVYDQPQANENAVHSLEHGAVWVTYDPEKVDAAGIQTLRAAMPSTYAILSPYSGLPAPVVASAWGKQVQLDGPDDPRLAAFIQRFWQSAQAPEPGAACVGAIDGPGKIA